MKMANIRDPSIVLPIELIEHILLNLPLLDLLVSQRVSAIWRAIIDASSSIQQALFLQPYSKVAVETRNTSTKASTSEGNFIWVSENGQQLTHRPLLNPFLKGFVREPSWLTGSDRKCPAALLNEGFIFCTDPWRSNLEEVRINESYVSNPFKSSLWRMLPIQPAARFLVSRCPDRDDPPDDTYFQLLDEEWLDTIYNVEAAGENIDGYFEDYFQPDFRIEPHGPSGGLVRIGDMVNNCWNHFQSCQDNCRSLEEVEEWRWHGDEDVERLIKDVA